MYVPYCEGYNHAMSIYEGLALILDGNGWIMSTVWEVNYASSPVQTVESVKGSVMMWQFTVEVKLVLVSCAVL